MDVNLVIRANYSEYLKATGYEPVDNHNFLRGWTFTNESGKGNYQVPSGTEDVPVTSITVDEAQNYCSYQGKRLPHSYEW